MADREFPGVKYINLDKRCILMGDGPMLPITRFFDANGDDCDPEEAVSCVAGNDDYGWVAVDISGPDDPVPVH